MSEQEKITVFDEAGNKLGIATREEVHRNGHWHQTFHCWMMSKSGGKNFIFFQLRSRLKKDFPDLLDVTAAGHILFDESVADGIREVKEELGLNISYDDLVPLGVIKDEITMKDFMDKELANVFLYWLRDDDSMGKFRLQEEEVSGVVKAEFDDFYELWLRERDTIEVEGFGVGQDGGWKRVKKRVDKTDFVPHDRRYYETVLTLIKEKLDVDEQIFKLKNVLFDAWSLESSSKWSESNPAKGQCGVTSLVVNDWFGGEIRKTKTPEGWHFYNKINGKRYDLTESQFSTPIEYMDILSNREEAFLDTNENQYNYLRERVMMLIAAFDERENR